MTLAGAGVTRMSHTCPLIFLCIILMASAKLPYQMSLSFSGNNPLSFTRITLPSEIKSFNWLTALNGIITSLWAWVCIQTLWFQLTQPKQVFQLLICNIPRLICSNSQFRQIIHHNTLIGFHQRNRISLSIRFNSSFRFCKELIHIRIINIARFSQTFYHCPIRDCK